MPASSISVRTQAVDAGAVESIVKATEFEAVPPLSVAIATEQT